jgi:Cu(I)/Ag(I) efflux system membrane fusion protein
MKMKRALILVAIAGLFVAGSPRVVAGAQDTRTGATAQVKQDTLDNVQGSCGMCKTRLETTAKSVQGVTAASWDRKTKRLALTLDPKKTSLDAVARALAKVGHDAGKARADDAVYNALPGCCKYRK